MDRRFQFSLRALLVGACLVGPALLLSRWLFNLSFLGVVALILIGAILAKVLISQFILLKIMTKSRKD
ncbi:MAG TPA: hypothetical protein VG125_12435 [Pirellulales bacterium]|jgi:hypothetical protein|nr:hypothetical protein [Pirellulales bacterium]